MDEKEIRKLIEKGESEKIEFKESLNMKNEIGETISAFANVNGGIILIGIQDKGVIKGLELGKRSFEELANFIKQNTDNPVYPEISIMEINEKEILVLKVRESSEKPVFFKGNAYKRVGKSNHKINASEIRRLAKESHKSYWDEQICDGTSLDDIDWNFIEKEFVSLYEKIYERKIEGKLKELLESFECIKNNIPTNAGIILFGKKPQKFFINAYIALARYKGDVEDSERLDYKEFTGNLFQQIDKCNEYIKEHVAIMSRLKPGEIRREDIPEYGFFSIRELITNAVCHRNYWEKGSKVIIKMFNGRIDYYNPGGLEKNITPKNIIQKQYSRNPIIAKVLSKVRYIEELGEGWNKIMKEHKEHPLHPTFPKIIADTSSMLVSLYSTKKKFKEREKILELNERQKKALEYLKEKTRITNEEYQKINNINRITAFRDLKDLVKKQVIEMVGKTGRQTYYIMKRL